MKNNRKTFPLLAITLLPVSILAMVARGPTTRELTLVRDGEPAASIILTENPTRVAQLAAYELQWHIQQITGATLPILDSPGDGTHLVVGAHPRAEAIGLNDWEPQQYAIWAEHDSLFLVGDDAPRTGDVIYDFEDPFAFRSWPDMFESQGTLHAVYRFLETHGNVRWWNPTEFGLDIPRSTTLTVRIENRRYRPAFPYRETGFENISERYDAGTQLWHRDDPEFDQYVAMAYPAQTTRWGQNRNHWTHGHRGWMRLWLMRMRLGGSERYRANHSFYNFYERFLEPDHANFKSLRPNLFAQGYDENRQPPQLCYSHPETVAQVIEDARHYFDHGGYTQDMRGIRAGYQWFEDYFAVVPMDNSAYCRCDACRAQTNETEADSSFFSNGRWSNYIFGFANQVARELRKAHPDKFVATLAYASYARYPDNVQLEDNIAVQLCLHVRNVYDQAMQANDLEILRTWTDREQDRRIFLWLYYCFPLERGHRSSPRWHVFPGFFADTIGASFKLYQSLGIRGAFFNGFGQEVDAYVTLRMLQDPSESVDEILDEYFTRMYGAAGEPLMAFYRMVERIYGDPENYTPNDRGRIGHQTQTMAWTQLGTVERMDQLEALVSEAHGRAETDLERTRVRLFDHAVWQYMHRAVHETVQMDHLEAWDDHSIRLERVIGRKPTLRDNALRGMTFQLETPGTLLIADPHVPAGRPFEALTNGESDTVFVHGQADIVFLADLGDVPEGGRSLRELRVYWSIADSARNRAALEFEVRDAQSGTWTAITPRLVSDDRVAMANSYRRLTIPFPEGAVRNFDALRMRDHSIAQEWNTTRWIEIEAEFAP